jgi:uncharacterized membrane protein YebE (DUF533 family)
MSDAHDIKDKVAATGLSAGIVIGAGAAAGAALAYGAYRFFRKRKPSRSQNTPGTALSP